MPPTSKRKTKKPQQTINQSQVNLNGSGTLIKQKSHTGTPWFLIKIRRHNELQK